MATFTDGPLSIGYSNTGLPLNKASIRLLSADGSMKVDTVIDYKIIENFIAFYREHEGNTLANPKADEPPKRRRTKKAS